MKRWFPSENVLTANKMMENPVTCNLVQVVVSLLLQLIMSPKGPDFFLLPEVLLKLSAQSSAFEVCITRLCCCHSCLFEGRYWPAVHWLVFNQSEHCDGCELPVLSKPCEILLYTLSPQRCNDPAASRTELREWVRALVCVVFSGGVLLSERL